MKLRRWCGVVAAVATVSGWPRVAHSCDCLDRPPAARAAEVGIVFRGRAVRWVDDGALEVEVLEVWKGEPSNPIVLTNDFYGDCWASVGPGEQAIFFLYGPDTASEGSISDCNTEVDDVEHVARALDRAYGMECAVGPHGSGGAWPLAILMLCLPGRRWRRSSR